MVLAVADATNLRLVLRLILELKAVGRPMVLRVAASLVVSPLIFWGIFTLLDMVVDAVAGEDAGWWWPGEGAILLTGLLFASAGAVALVRRRTAAIPVPS